MVLLRDTVDSRDGGRAWQVKDKLRSGTIPYHHYHGGTVQYQPYHTTLLLGMSTKATWWWYQYHLRTSTPSKTRPYDGFILYSLCHVIHPVLQHIFYSMTNLALWYGSRIQWKRKISFPFDMLGSTFPKHVKPGRKHSDYQTFTVRTN